MGMAISVPRYTVDDLEHFPKDGNRYELLDGILLVTPGPGLPHQGVGGRLQGRLYESVQRPGHAYVVGPGAVTLPPLTQLEPDLLVFPASADLNGKWADVSGHWLAVEILSRGSRVYDRDFKRDAYLALGVAEVWLVDLLARRVEISRAPRTYDVVRDVIRWRPPTLDLVVPIDLAEVFAGLE
jgi:Uma2 family endonuclease